MRRGSCLGTDGVYYEGTAWAFGEAVGASVSVAGCSEKELVDGAQGGTHLVSRLRGCAGAHS